jgi:hypothetical protein
MLAAALEVFRKEVDMSRSVRLSSTLLHGAIVG